MQCVKTILRPTFGQFTSNMVILGKKMPEKISNRLFICVFLSSLFLANGADEIENEREFNYLEHSNVGPDHWGDLHAEWSACKKGKLQSPIDLFHGRAKLKTDLGKLRKSYKAADAVLMNRGHDIMLKWKSDPGSLEIGGTQFSLKQCHWHSPSEHSFNGSRYQLEAHMVHSTSNDQLAVIGIMYVYGKPDPLLTKILPMIKNINGTQEKPVGAVNPQELIFEAGQHYYRYLGSLTVPPCTEGVIWTIMKRVKTVSKEQIDVLRQAVHDGYEANARPLQAENMRNIAFYRPSHSPE